jgi:hypothetical protein
MLSIDRWHIPLQSKLNYYRLAETLLETPIADLTESDLAINASCLTYKWDNTHPKLFGGMDVDGNERVADYFATPVYENSFGIKGFWAKGKIQFQCKVIYNLNQCKIKANEWFVKIMFFFNSSAKRARSYVTLKDNKSFVVFVVCWEDEESSWQVISTDASLDEEVKNEILDHVKTLGFKEENTYDTNCPDTQQFVNLSAKTEL